MHKEWKFDLKYGSATKNAEIANSWCSCVKLERWPAAAGWLRSESTSSQQVLHLLHELLVCVVFGQLGLRLLDLQTGKQIHWLIYIIKSKHRSFKATFSQIIYKYIKGAVARNYLMTFSLWIFYVQSSPENDPLMVLFYRVTYFKNPFFTFQMCKMFWISDTSTYKSVNFTTKFGTNL